MTNLDSNRPDGWAVNALDRKSVRSKSDSGSTHPCVSCGACCAFFRASFYFGECSAYGIPEDMVVQVSPFLVAMKGTTTRTETRCVALKGTIGQFGTTCSIYHQRSSTCRDFVPSFEDGVTHTPECDRARQAHGLRPLVRSDWKAYHLEQEESLNHGSV